MNDQLQNPEVTRVECPSARDPAVRLFIFAAMMLGFGIYTIYDHYIQGNYTRPEPYSLNPYLKYLFNHYTPYLLVPIGLIAVILAIRHLLRKLTADQTGIGFGTERIAWNRIDRLDASKLKDKGMLYLHYGAETLTLHSWKLQNFRQLVAFVEKNVSQEVQQKPE